MKEHKYNLLHCESKVASSHPKIDENLPIIPLKKTSPSLMIPKMSRATKM